MQFQDSLKALTGNQISHLKVLKDKVFELNKYPSFKLLIDGLEKILIKYDFKEKNICILERTKLYGTSLFGGRGSVWNAILGALVIGSLGNGLDLSGASAADKLMFSGAILLLAVAIDAVSRVSTSEG